MKNFNVEFEARFTKRGDVAEIMKAATKQEYLLVVTGPPKIAELKSWRLTLYYRLTKFLRAALRINQVSRQTESGK